MTTRIDMEKNGTKEMDASGSILGWEWLECGNRITCEVWISLLTFQVYVQIFHLNVPQFYSTR